MRLEGTEVFRFKACPFCGSESIPVYNGESRQCTWDKCEATAPTSLWNTRYKEKLMSDIYWAVRGNVQEAIKQAMLNLEKYWDLPKDDGSNRS